MQFTLPLISNPHKQQIISILRHFGRILLAFNLLYGGVNGLVVFQFDDDGGRIDVLTRDEHQVCDALAYGQLAVDDVVVGGVIVGNA